MLHILPQNNPPKHIYAIVFMSSASSSRRISGVSFAELRAGLEARRFGFTKTTSTRDRDAGTTRVFFGEKAGKTNTLLRLGDISAPVSSQPVVKTDPHPGKNAVNDNQRRCLVSVMESERDDMIACKNLLYQIALEDGVFPGVDSIEAVKERLQLPFSLPDPVTGTGDFGVWTKLQLTVPRASMERLKTSFLVVRRTETTNDDGSVSAEFSAVGSDYDGKRVQRGQSLCAILELGECREYNGKRYLDAEARVVTLDESVANMDPSFVPVASSSRVKPTLAFPHDGGYWLFGSSKFPEPVWVAGDSEVLNGVHILPDAKRLAQKFTEDKSVKLEGVEVKPKPGAEPDARFPPGSKRWFLNDDAYKGSLLSREGDFDMPGDLQTYLTTTPAPHKSAAADSKSFGALFAIADSSVADAYRVISRTVLEQAIDLGVANNGSKKRIALEVAKERIKLPGVDPLDDEDAEGNADFAVGVNKHYCLWEKFQMEPPSGIEDLQTRFYEIDGKVATRVSGYELRKGQKPVTVLDWSEMRKDTSAYRVVLYAKYVFFLKNEPAGMPDEVAWGDVSVTLPSPSKRSRTQE